MTGRISSRKASYTTVNVSGWPAICRNSVASIHKAYPCIRALADDVRLKRHQATGGAGHGAVVGGPAGEGQGAVGEPLPQREEDCEEQENDNDGTRAAT